MKNRIPNWMYDTMIAHRGFFDDDAPENSLKSFQQAVDRGFGIELDVQMLKDKTLVVFHDDALERMTGYQGFLTQSTYDEIKDLRLKNTNERIPTFKEMLELVNGQVPLMVEFKNESNSTEMERIGYEILKDYKGKYIMQSFNPLSVNWFRKHAKEVVRGQLSCRHEKVKWPLRFIMRNVMTNIITRPDFVIYDIKALDSLIIKWLRFWKKPIFGYTAKSIQDYRDAMGHNVPAVFEQFDPKDL